MNPPVSVFTRIQPNHVHDKTRHVKTCRQITQLLKDVEIPSDLITEDVHSGSSAQWRTNAVLPRRRGAGHRGAAFGKRQLFHGVY